MTLTPSSLKDLEEVRAANRPLSDYAIARDAARASRRGQTLYPRLSVLGGVWVLQNHPGDAYVVVPQDGAEHLLLADEGTTA